MENRRVPEYFNDDFTSLTDGEGLPVEKRLERVRKAMAQDRCHMEWKVRNDKQWDLITDVDVEEFREYENYERHGILPTAYPEVVNGYPPRSFEYYHRRNRAICAGTFTNGYKFVEGLKCLIISEKPHPIPSFKCFDSTWVAVHGMDSICVVTRRQIMDITRVAPFFQEFSTTQIMCGYAEAMISLLECLPYDDSIYNDDDLRLGFGHMIKAPFSAVSVGLDAVKVNEGNGHEVISYEYDVTKAAIFLEGNMKSGLAFSDDETIQAAIIAFQHMCRWELKADDLWVTCLKIPYNYTRHLDLDEIKDQFAVIKGGSSAAALPKSVLFGCQSPDLTCDNESGLNA